MIRKSTIKDMTFIRELLQYYGQKGEMLARPLSQLYDHVRDFSVFVDPETDVLLGFAALQFCWEDLAEIRSLAVRPENPGQGIGSRLVRELIEEAKSYGVKNELIHRLKSTLLTD